MYFDMYWAGWEKFQIPWALLWIMHIQESLVSRDAKADFNGDGALQVTRANISNPHIKSAPDGYRSLEDKTQRFSVRGGRRTTDSEEILHGAAYIRVVVNEKKRAGDTSHVELTSSRILAN